MLFVTLLPFLAVTTLVDSHHHSELRRANCSSFPHRAGHFQFILNTVPTLVLVKQCFHQPPCASGLLSCLFTALSPGSSDEAGSLSASCWVVPQLVPSSALVYSRRPGQARCPFLPPRALSHLCSFTVIISLFSVCPSPLQQPRFLTCFWKVFPDHCGLNSYVSHL